MAQQSSSGRSLYHRFALTAFAAALSLTVSHSDAADPGPSFDILHVGAAASLTGDRDPSKEKAAIETLRSFIQDETGFRNEVGHQKDWSELADKLANNELQLGVFQGYEFAWAQAKHPGLKPLAVATNGYVYPIAFVLTQRDDPATDFAGLQNQSLGLAATNQGFLRLFLDRQSEANGKRPNAFFSKSSVEQSVEDALDDVVDGKVQVTAVDRTGLEAYKRRKPGRFNRLKEIAHSKPFPAGVVAYYGSNLDETTLRTLKDGLLGAATKEKGQTLLNLAHLTGFENVPDGFVQVLAETLQAYPAPTASK